MENIEYLNSLYQINEILKYVAPNLKARIPKKVISYIENNKAKTVISTHFLSISELLDEYENKINFLQILNENKREIIKGISNESKGIEALIEEKMPDEIIKYSMEVYNL